MNSKKIAIDVVLLPPEEIMELCIGINREEAAKGNAKKELGRNDFIPHLSLAVGRVQKENFSKVKRLVQKIARKTVPLKLELVDLNYAIGSDGTKTYYLKIKNNKKLQQLHELIMKTLEPYLTYDATVADLYSKPGEQIQAPDYINQFRMKNSFEHFDPHITLWVRSSLFNDFPISFIPLTLAICHLGVGTTCRKILFSTSLKENKPRNK